MADNKRTQRDLNNQVDVVREVFQSLLKAHIKDKSDIDGLARAINKSSSLVKKMLYKGEGGLDVWSMALIHLYKLDESSLKSLQVELRRQKPVSEADQIWFSIQNEMGATDEDMFYLASCAREAYRIKSEIDHLKKKRKTHK